jgi:hypothetical protein
MPIEYEHWEAQVALRQLDHDQPSIVLEMAPPDLPLVGASDDDESRRRSDGGRTRRDGKLDPVVNLETSLCG